MIMTGKSDLASALGLRSQQTHIRGMLDTKSKELATGQKSNLVKATNGDLGRLFSIERTLALLSTEDGVLKIAEGKTKLMQLSLEQVQNNTSELGPTLLSAAGRGDFHAMNIMAGDAENALRSTVSALNVQYSRHSIFSGSATDSPSLAPADDIIADIAAIVAASPDASSAIAAIDNYFFLPGGGFETNIYTGSANNAPAFIDESGASIDYAIKSDAPEIRKTLRALSLAVVASRDPGFSGTVNQKILTQAAGNSMISATNSVTELREVLGFAEGNISQSRTLNTAKSDIFELERLAIVSAEPYETATMFEALQGQLQSVYTITARLSNLSLANFLR